MWLQILKYAAKIAVATGLAEKAKGWLHSKIAGAAEKAEKKADEYADKVADQVTDVFDELDKKNL